MSRLESRIVSFGRALRDAGLPIGVDQNERFARALTLIDPFRDDRLYHAARASYLFRHEDRPLFDAVFERFWGRPAPQESPAPQKTPRAPRHDPSAFQRTALVSFMSRQAAQQDREIDLPDRTDTASDTEVLQRKDFSEMTPEELRATRRALAAMRWRIAERRTRRRVPDSRGDRLDLGRALRGSVRTGGKLVHLPRRSRKIKPRPLVVIADISGSMELYSRIVLQLFHSLSQSFDGTESFVFGTRLTRVTAALRLRDVDAALAEVSSEVVDFAGGTRIGESLRTFNRSWARRVLRRGAVVILVSDGLERGDPELLRREMRRLHGRCHRVIWLNPRLGHRAYEPRAAGMAAALEWIDDFLPVHDLQSLEVLAAHLSDLPARKTGRPERALTLNMGGIR